MYDMNDILVRLQNGETLDAIGNEFAQMMNDAQAAYVKAQKEAEEKAKAEKNAFTRRVLVRDILDAIVAYANHTDYANTINEWAAEATEEDIMNIDAQLLDMLKTVEALKHLTFNMRKSPRVSTSKTADPDQALTDFLKLMGL